MISILNLYFKKVCKTFYYIIISFLLSSCAFHPSFPFICFKKDCIRMQFSGVRKEAGGNMSIKKRASIMVKKFNQKLRKSNRVPKTKLDKFDREVVAVILSDTTNVEEFIKMIFLVIGNF